MTVNGDPPDEAGGAEGAQASETPQKDFLRKLNHEQWLRSFAIALGASPPGGRAPAMTPFRQGAISRLKLAADYLGMLERDLKRAEAALDHHLKADRSREP